MPKYRISLLPGDGVGSEVVECAYRILKKLNLDASYTFCDIGWKFWKSEGNALPQRTIKELKESDCALLGAITSKPAEEAEAELPDNLKRKGLKYKSPILMLRQLLNLSVNVRPCISIRGNKLNYRDNINITIFRENTEGLYCGIEYFPFPEELYQVVYKDHHSIEKYKKLGLDKTAVSFRIMSESGCEKIIRSGFEFARRNGKKTVTVVDKPNILRETGGLFYRAAYDVAKEFPEINLTTENIDAMCMRIVKNPEDFDVIICENMFGDIISDLAAQLVGGMGFAYSGNIGDNFAIFEPVHGSAPKYANQHKVNPVATILAAKYMLSWLGEDNLSNRIEEAVKSVVNEHKVGTYDMGLYCTNIQLTDEIISKL